MFAENRREDKDMKLLVADDERWIRKGIIKMIDLERFSFEEVLEAGTLKEYEENFWKPGQRSSCPMCVFQMEPAASFARNFIKSCRSQSLSCFPDIMISSM